MVGLAAIVQEMLGDSAVSRASFQYKWINGSITHIKSLPYKEAFTTVVSSRRSLDCKFVLFFLGG